MKKNKLFSSVGKYIKCTDKVLWLIVFGIAVFSLQLLQSVSRATNTNYYNTQLMAVIIGLIGAVIVSVVNYETIGNYWYLISGASVFLMLYTIFFGINISSSGGVDATAWISLGGRTFQPSELVKIAFMVTYAKHLSVVKKNNKLDNTLQVFLLACHAAVPVLLCHLQGDDGAGVVFFAMFIFMSLSAGIPIKYFAALGAVVLVSIPIAWKYVLNEYQKLRFTAVYNIDDPVVALNEGYQQYQGRISIGSGRLFGQGLFHGPRVETNAVTFQHSDFIFSVAGEELGFVGCTLIILSLFLLMWRTVYIGMNSKTDMGKYICFGFFGLIALQTISNIGMCLALLPVMGVTLPFYSAGGSSAACLYLGIGLVQSVNIKGFDSNSLDYRKSKLVHPGYLKMKDINM